MKLINSITFVLTMLISVAGIYATDSKLLFSKETQKRIERIKKSGTQNEKDLAVKLYAGKIDEAYFK